MRAFIAPSLAALLTLSAPVAVAAPADDAVTRFKQWLWPSKPVPLPVPAPLPKVEPPPVVVPPPVIEPPPKPEPPKVELPEVKPQPPPARPKAKPKPRRPKVAKDEGPDLPWPCWLVRLHAAGKTDAELEAMRRVNNVTLTPKQIRQAQACLRGLPRHQNNEKTPSR